MANTKLPAGPPESPFFQLIKWTSDPLSYLDTCSERYGDIFTIRMAGYAPHVFLSDPQAIKEIFTADPGLYDCSLETKVAQPIVGENALLVQDGVPHQRLRRMLMPAFHAKQIQTYSQLICERTRQVANQWAVGQPFEVRAAMIEIAADVIMHLVFGSYEGERYQKIKFHLAATLNVTNSSPYLLLFKFMQKDLGAWSPWGRFQRQRNKVYEFFQAEINERRKKPEIADNTLLSVVMSARDENGQALTDAELKDLLMNALFGGYDTTAIALSWALYWVHKLPQVREKLLNEIDSLGSNQDPMAITRLPYLNAVCSETLRIHPSIFYAFPRVPKSPVQVMGYQFDAGTRLVPSIYLLHRREDLYPESSQFKPERFIDRQFSPYEYMPFGGGNRGCIGVALAMFQMKLVLATLLSEYQLTLADSESVKPKRIGLIIAPSDVRMVLQGRRQHREQTQGAAASSI